MTLKKSKIENILCPTDFSECAEHAFEHAVAMARWFGAKLTVLHVSPFNAPVGGGAPYWSEPAPLSAAAREGLQEELRRFVGPARTQGLDAEVVLEEGDPAADILRAADTLPAQMIVMGTHGRRGFERFFLGSVTERVVRKAPCPVLAVGKARAAGGIKPFFGTIVCGLDLRGDSTRAMGCALDLASEAKVRLVFVHVNENVPSPDAPAYVRLVVPETEPYRRALEDEARKALKALIPEEARSRHDVEEHVRAGNAYEEILSLAREKKADLIVLGPRGRGGLDRLFFGSTVQHVIRDAPCPVLVVRPLAHDRPSVEREGAAVEKAPVRAR